MDKVFLELKLCNEVRRSLIYIAFAAKCNEKYKPTTEDEVATAVYDFKEAYPLLDADELISICKVLMEKPEDGCSNPLSVFGVTGAGYKLHKIICTDFEYFKDLYNSIK